MGVKLSEMKNRTKTITVDWDGEKVDVSYFPNVVTPQLLEDVEKAVSEQEAELYGAMFEPVLDWWDILTDDGSRLPTDAATISTIPLSFIFSVQNAIQKDQNPPE